MKSKIKKKNTRGKNAKSGKISRKINKKMSFSEIMQKYPEAAELLMEKGLHCIGCGMASYETLEQGALMHGLNPDKLVNEINKKLGKEKMTTALEILIDEHRKILEEVENIEKETSLIKGGGDLNLDFFKDAVYFIKNYADKFHHAKEENILFKELNKPGVLKHCNPVRQMLLEHEIGRDFVGGIEEGIYEKDKNKIIENARDYIDLIREHIAKEDDILYPMADEELSEETKKEMLKKFRSIEYKK